MKKPTIFLLKSHKSYVSIIIISTWPFITGKQTKSLYLSIKLMLLMERKFNFIFHSFPINTSTYNTKMYSCYQSKWSSGYNL